MRYLWQVKLKHRYLNAQRRRAGKFVYPDILNEKLADDIVALHWKKHKK
jgi:hypothetical protein